MTSASATLTSGRDAGARGTAADVHRAGAAHADAAAELRAGEADVVADHPQQRRIVFGVDLNCAAIDVKCSHVQSPNEVLLRCDDLPADRGDLRFEVRPGRKIRARAPQVGRDAGDVGVAERLPKARHDHARYSVLGIDAAQDDLNEIVRLGQIQRAVERKVRPDREGRLTRIVVAGRAGRGVEARVRVVLAGA